jgi:hypothetical protein
LTASAGIKFGRRNGTMDVIYVGLSVGFFALTWLLVKLCERV